MKQRIDMVFGLLHDIRTLQLDPLKMNAKEWEDTVAGMILEYSNVTKAV
jgi:hypothetical protein